MYFETEGVLDILQNFDNYFLTCGLGHMLT